MRHIPGLMAADSENESAFALEIDRQIVETAFRDAALKYVATRRTRIDYFTRRHFSFGGALRLHRVALGADLIRAPANLALALRIS